MALNLVFSRALTMAENVTAENVTANSTSGGAHDARD
jgi:hypothetical protein